MRAVVFHAIGDIRLEDVPDPQISEPTDAVVRITTSAICGTDLHFVRGSMGPMQEGTILGHEAVGVVEEVGPAVRNLVEGDRVIVPSTIGCGYCSYCRAGYFAQCDNANPNGPQAGTAFYGGPTSTGPFDGVQAERARIPFANVGLVKVPDAVSDEQAIMLSDIYPTAWFGARLAEVSPGDTVAVLGCGPVGLFAVLSALQQGAGRVLAVDTIPSRLDAARRLGAETLDFNAEHPVGTIQELTGGIGVDRMIDAVGVDAEPAGSGPAAEQSQAQRGQFDEELGQVAQEGANTDPDWGTGKAPSQALQWAVQAVAKAGTIGIIGVYPPGLGAFPIGAAMNRNLTLHMGNCNHRRYIPELLAMTAAGAVDPTTVLTQERGVTGVMEAYDRFNHREEGWIKVALDVG